MQSVDSNKKKNLGAFRNKPRLSILFFSHDILLHRWSSKTWDADINAFLWFSCHFPYNRCEGGSKRRLEGQTAKGEEQRMKRWETEGQDETFASVSRPALFPPGFHRPVNSARRTDLCASHTLTTRRCGHHLVAGHSQCYSSAPRSSFLIYACVDSVSLRANAAKQRRRIILLAIE